jgi:signal transduction histidine kinase
MENTIIALTESFRKIKMAENEDEIYDIAIHSLKNILNFNNAAIFRVEGDKLVLVRTIGYRMTHLKLDLNGEKGIVAWVARNKRSLYVPDVTKEPLYIDTQAGSKCEYATPIIIDGVVYGVLDVEGKEIGGISEEERNLIDMLAQHMSVALKSVEKQRELEKAKNYQELMLRIVSHDLKNPLSVISGYLELLQEEYAPEYIKVIEKATERAFEIIEKARLFSKLGTKGIEEEKIEIDLCEEIKIVSSIIEAKYPEAKIDMALSSLKIQGYPLLREVFLNILDNAFKYGAQHVRIEGEKDEKYVTLKFADDGPGIPDEKKNIIFDAFETLEHGGSGLGLNIVKMIVEMHHGKVWVEDNEPKGSVFVLKLPIH